METIKIYCGLCGREFTTTKEYLNSHEEEVSLGHKIEAMHKGPNNSITEVCCTVSNTDCDICHICAGECFSELISNYRRNAKQLMKKPLMGKYEQI